jgi:NgoMIV restriction enzyme
VSASHWLLDLLGWKPATAKSAARCRALFGEAHAPNIADVGSVESLKLAAEVYRALGVDRITNVQLADTDTGSSLEIAVANDLDRRLLEMDPNRSWLVRRGGWASDYLQFQHLGELQHLLEAQPTLRATVGHDYQVKTDVYVGLPGPRKGSSPFLHAAISCKWTIRSDRVQNVRHEFSTLVRSRRGRLPHLVLITAEPLPTRIISIARGTGEVDVVYHVMFHELSAAVTAYASPKQVSAWEEMLSQGRLKPYEALAADLTLN